MMSLWVTPGKHWAGLRVPQAQGNVARQELKFIYLRKRRKREEKA